MKTDLCVGSIGMAESDEWETAWTGSYFYEARDGVVLLTMSDIFLLCAADRMEIDGK